jgi:hypothetical protein
MSRPAVGDTPNFSARLQALVEPGTIVVTESARLDLFKLRDLKCHEVKGSAKPTRVPYFGRKRLPKGASRPSVATATASIVATARIFTVMSICRSNRSALSRSMSRSLSIFPGSTRFGCPFLNQLADSSNSACCVSKGPKLLSALSLSPRHLEVTYRCIFIHGHIC